MPPLPTGYWLAENQTLGAMQTQLYGAFSQNATGTWVQPWVQPLATGFAFGYPAVPSQVVISGRFAQVVVTGYGTGTGTGYNPISLAAQPETPTQRRERKRQARLDDLAAARAKALLLEFLSEAQRAEYEEKRYFHVLGQGGRLYRIKHGSVGNVYAIGNDGKVEGKYCIHARDHVPTEDNMLAQMLLLRCDEEQFLATANRHW